jgi:hypothetical protein
MIKNIHFKSKRNAYLKIYIYIKCKHDDCVCLICRWLLRVWEKKIENALLYKEYSHRNEERRRYLYPTKTIMLLLFIAYQPTRPTLPFTRRKKRKRMYLWMSCVVCAVEKKKNRRRQCIMWGNGGGGHDVLAKSQDKRLNETNQRTNAPFLFSWLAINFFCVGRFSSFFFLLLLLIHTNRKIYWQTIGLIKTIEKTTYEQISLSSLN